MKLIAASNMCPAGNGTRAFRVILYSREHDFEPYVVHYEAEEGDRWQGDYCASIAEAAAEFERRCKSWGLHDAAVREVWSNEAADWVGV